MHIDKGNFGVLKCLLNLCIEFQSQRVRDIKKELRVVVAGRGKGGKMGGRNSCWVGMDKHTLLYLKWINNKDLLHSTSNCAQCYVAAWRWGAGEGRVQFGGE